MAAATIDPAEWFKKDFSERVRIGSEMWVAGGMGTPLVAYLFHALKLGFFIAGWMFFCSFTPGLGNPTKLGSWCFEGIAFQKAFLWAELFEVFGLGCMSGPLGMRLWPPFTTFLYYLRPGTTKLAPFPDLPVFGGITRTWLDVALYAAFLLSLVRALVQPEIGPAHLVPIVVLLPLCGLGDKTIPLCARAEHHFAMIVCFLVADNWIAACKWVQLSIWFWAGISKLTPAFGYVVPIMTANNPLLKSPTLRRRMFASYPDDLSPSRLGVVMAHGGTFLELATPICLCLVTNPGQPMLYAGLAFALMLHGYIISNLPIGAVFEWNVLSLYAAFFLFLGYPDASLFAVGSVLATAFLLVNSLILPVLGNLVPSKVSFLTSMRYYAGNWAWNAWFFHNGSHRKLEKLKRAMGLLREQQGKLLTPEMVVMTDAMALTSRALYLQGHILGKLIPKLIGENAFQDYTYDDGEIVSASVLGWNFGDGHSSHERLIEAVQAQCGFDAGELRVICVESQPILGSTLHWRIVDAKTGPLDEGHAEISDLAKRQPWDWGEI